MDQHGSKNISEKYDLLVVGRVAVLEVALQEDRGGATRWTTAAFRISSNDRLDPLWVGTVAEVSNGLSNLDCCRRFESEVPTTLSILKQCQVEILYAPSPTPIAVAAISGGAVPNGGGHAS